MQLECKGLCSTSHTSFIYIAISYARRTFVKEQRLQMINSSLVAYDLDGEFKKSLFVEGISFRKTSMVLWFTSIETDADLFLLIVPLEWHIGHNNLVSQRTG